MTRYSIETYNRKRDFRQTREPAGRTGVKKSKQLGFVIQKHAASRLHYDFRLEMGGVLKSWAVPKGPSLNPKDKRLAVRTEDHPLSYAGFEGSIPKDHYGAGSVMVWDTGVWQPGMQDPLQALAKGKIAFRLSGKKLSGNWNLVRIRGRKNEKAENWLLIKDQDEHADTAADGFLEQTDFSAKTGRAFAEIAEQESDALETLMDRYRAMQLATLVDTPPLSSAWVHEVKYDGYRIMAFVSNDKVIIRTRNGLDWTHKFAPIAAALGRFNAGTFVIDGEVVVLNSRGVSSFQALQASLKEGDVGIKAFFFDLLYWNDTDYTPSAFRVRRKTLEKLFRHAAAGKVVFLSEFIPGKAASIVKQACNLGLEGIISKKADSIYQPRRSKSWLKIKCIKRQEFVISGFVPASDSPKSVGALHLGYYQNNKLLHAGKIGTGFNREEAAGLYRTLSKMARPTHPFATSPASATKGTVWVNPELLCEVSFTELTDSGKIRHGSYQGLRMDKVASEVVEENPVKMRAGKSDAYRVKGVNITHPDRIIFPDAGLSKVELAEFYAAMAEFILADIRDRPITVVRCPGGIAKQCFYQRGKETLPAHVYRLDLIHGEKKHDYMYIRDITGLMELVQMSVIEIHPWGALRGNIEKPDRIIFDLDPAPDVPFEAVKLAAADVRQRLQELNLDSFAKVSGGKGVHVVIPVQRRHDWSVIKTFAKGFAERMVKDVPQAYVATMSKKKRDGKIFIDYFRNDYASTAVMNYCVRSRPGAPVALPVYWDELDGLTSSDQFTISQARKRLKQARKLLEQYQDCRQALTKQMMQRFA